MIYKYKTIGIQDLTGLNIHCTEQINDKKKCHLINVLEVATEKFHIVILI